MTRSHSGRPAKLAIQVIGPTTLRKTREAYRARWGRKWPETDSYLAELIIEAKEHEGVDPSSKAKPQKVRETALDLMRADHEF